MIQLSDKSHCCGCYACVQACPKQCIQMLKDNEGFVYPHVDAASCIDCGLCQKTCPVINQDEPRKPLKVYAAKHPNDEIRSKSSSGGIFTFLAEQIIKEGGVVFGARFDESWQVVHDYTDSVEGLEPFRGSKYVQSKIGNSYKLVQDFLTQGHKVMFAGTPCQVAGLKKFLRKEYDNLLAVDFVCHGVPSPLVWRKYLDELRETHRTQCGAGKNTDPSSLNDLPVITGVSFRDKTHGWKKYGFKLCLEDKKTFLEPFTENHFMRAFLADYILRPSCYACPSKTGKSSSDITIGDLWGADRFNPSIDDDKGLSLVMLHNDKSKEFVVKCNLEEIDYLPALNNNPSIEHSVSIPVYRTFYWHLLHQGKSISDILYMCQSSKTTARLRRFAYRKLKM